MERRVVWFGELDRASPIVADVELQFQQTVEPQQRHVRAAHGIGGRDIQIGQIRANLINRRLYPTSGQLLVGNYQERI